MTHPDAPRRAPYVTSPEGMAALDASFTRSFKLYRPPDPLTLSQWADKYAYIPKEAGAFPGKFQTSFAEYQRGIMDSITDPEIETVILMMCAQSGKTQIQLNAVGYYSHWEPAPILFVQTSLSEAEKFSKNRVAKMIRDTPVLKKLFPSPRSRDSGNTLLNKEFLGGVLILAGSNAPAGLSSMPIRVVLQDEVDRWEESAGTEGDPGDLADKRTQTFWNRKKIKASTPAIKNLSRIEKAYDSSDKSRYYVPCPHCGEMQVLEWRRLRYVTEPVGPQNRPRVTDFWYECSGPKQCIIHEADKFEMIRRGEWRATAESHDGKTAGFQLNALNSPVVDWLKLIHEWLEAKGSLERMKVFVNTNLAETWEIRGTGADMSDLEKRKEHFRDLLPAGVLYLTAGVDTQDNRLECSVIGWGLDDEEWEHTCGLTMRVRCALVDSGGHHTERVYEFTRKHELRRWHAIVGRGGIGRPLISSEHKVGPYETKLFTVGVDTAKEDIFTSFRVKESGPGYCHFSDTLMPEYFQQVTAEKLVTRKKDFHTIMEWVKVGERNEALDCFVYARAAVAIRRPNFRKIYREMFRQSEALRKQREAAGTPAPTPAEETIGPAAPPLPPPPKPPALPASTAPRRRRPNIAAQLRNRLR